jgi:cobalt-zinc-cadmium efflux system protein
VSKRVLTGRRQMSHDHNHDNHSHELQNNRGRLLGAIIFNTIITVAEYIGGIMSGSLALISDAGHNLSDVLSLILGYAGEKFSSAKTDKKYSFGMKRLEVFIATVNAASLIAVAVYILYESYERFKNPVTINISIMIPIAIVGLAGNVLSLIILSGGRKQNLNMKAAFLHLMYDAISSVAVIIAGVILYFTNIFWIDIAISLIIVLMIIWSSSGILKESFRIFFQGTPSGIDTDKVFNALSSLNSVKDVHGLHVWSINSTEVFLSCHLHIDSNNGDSIIKEANIMLNEKFGISHTTIQIENTLLCRNDGTCCR